MSLLQFFLFFAGVGGGRGGCVTQSEFLGWRLYVPLLFKFLPTPSLGTYVYRCNIPHSCVASLTLTNQNSCHFNALLLRNMYIMCEIRINQREPQISGKIIDVLINELEMQ